MFFFQHQKYFMQGLILIPDISGFTRFVNTINIQHGALVTRELLHEIIDANPFNLRLCEIEGDAILYFKIGKPILPDALFKGLKLVSEAFTRKYEALKHKYHVEAKLSLKFIVHYGNIMVYDICGFEKLFGQAVIEAHHLMKSGTDLSDYILITDDYLKAAVAIYGDILLPDYNLNNEGSQSIPGSRKVTYYFLNLNPAKHAGQDMYRNDVRA